MWLTTTEWTVFIIAGIGLSFPFLYMLWMMSGGGSSPGEDDPGT